MADWVHCNNCYIQPGPSRNFLLTSCGHIFCQKCVSSISKEKCSLCGTKFSAIPLTSQMRPDIEMYFTDPKELCKKYHKNLLQVMEFQNGHRSRFFAQFKNSDRDLRREFQQLHEKHSELQKCCGKLQEENQHLKCCFQQQNGRSMLSQTPCGSQVQNTNHMNNSISNGSLTPNISPNRISIRTPPVNGRLISGYSSNSSGGSNGSSSILRGIANLKSNYTPTGSQFDSPVRISPTSSLSSLKLLSSGQPLCATPNTAYNTPPHTSQYPGSSGTSNQSRLNHISPTRYQIRLPTGSSLGLIRRATVSPYNSQEDKEN